MVDGKKTLESVSKGETDRFLGAMVDRNRMETTLEDVGRNFLRRECSSHRRVSIKDKTHAKGRVVLLVGVKVVRDVDVSRRIAFRRRLGALLLGFRHCRRRGIWAHNL